MSAIINFKLNGQSVSASDEETIWQAANRLGVEIPYLCHKPADSYRPDGNCRACMVEIEGERTLAASCIRTPTEGMDVSTTSDRSKNSRKMVYKKNVDEMKTTPAHFSTTILKF